MVATLWLLLLLAIGIFMVAQALQFLDNRQAIESAASVSANVEGLTALETAVRVIGSFFTVMFGLRILDRFPFRGAVSRRLGFKPGNPNPLQVFTSVFVHGSDAHLFGNMRLLLLFAGIAALLLPSMAIFGVVTVSLLFVESLGILLFGSKNSSHIGASGMVLGYFSFNVVYGLNTGVDSGVMAIFLTLFFGRIVWFNLRHRGENVSQVGHIFGFIGGIVTALVLVRLGMY